MSKPGAIFGITRGGSSITARLLHILAGGAGWEIKDIGGVAYENGIPLHDITEETFLAAKTENTLIGPFRELPANATPILGSDVNKILVFRDPRDCLVSHYFAFKNIHSVFKAGEASSAEVKGSRIDISIDKYVSEHLNSFKITYLNYIELCRSGTSVMYSKYEDIAFDPLSWLSEMIAFLDLSPGNDAMNQAVIEAYFWRIGNDPFAHNRQGQSGDFLNHLLPETIEEINGEFAEVLDFLSYEKKPKRAIDYFEGASNSSEGLAQILYGQRLQIDEMKRAIHTLQRANGNTNTKINALQKQISGS